MTWNYLNPFIEYPNWPGHTQTRYKHAERILGRENLAAAMHSKTFQTALQIFPDEHWLLPFDRIDANRVVSEFLHLFKGFPTCDTMTAADYPNFLGAETLASEIELSTQSNLRTTFSLSTPT